MPRIIRALWPMVLWMGVVFCMSTDIGTEAHSGLILKTLFGWFNVHLTPGGFERAQFFFRKAGHVSEYAVLALMILRALRILHPRPSAAWSWTLAAWALGASAVYGASDEIHQIFVPTRGPSVHDVLIDSCGAAFGLLIAFLWTRMMRSSDEIA